MLLYQGWLNKDGSAMGSAKKRYFVLNLDNESFSLDYYTDDSKADKKGSFLIPQLSKFSRVVGKSHAPNCTFSVTVSSSGSFARSLFLGNVITFWASTPEEVNMWEIAFITRKVPVEGEKLNAEDLEAVEAEAKAKKTSVVEAAVEENAKQIPGAPRLAPNLQAEIAAKRASKNVAKVPENPLQNRQRLAPNLQAEIAAAKLAKQKSAEAEKATKHEEVAKSVEEVVAAAHVVEKEVVAAANIAEEETAAVPVVEEAVRTAETTDEVAATVAEE